MSAQAGFVAEQIEELNQQLPDLLADAAVEQALELLAVIRAARKQLAELEAIVERHAAKAMDGKQHEWDGGVALRRSGKKRTTWQHDDLARAVTMSALVDPETGEMPADEVDVAVQRAVSALLNAAAITYWRVTQVKALGIDPDDYCHSEPGHTSVEVHVGAEAEAA